MSETLTFGIEKGNTRVNFTPLEDHRTGVSSVSPYSSEIKTKKS